MEKALEIIQHIEKLYSKDYDENYATKLLSKNPDMVEAWSDAFKDYDLTDVLCAIDEYWNYKSSKSKPAVAHIKAMLNVKKDVEKVVKQETRELYTDYANELMARDIELGRNRYLLPVYQKAVRYIAEDLLAKEISFEEWKGLDFAGKCERAMSVGLFNEFYNALVYICRKYHGKDYQYDSANMLRSNMVNFDCGETLGNLAKHFKMGA